VTLTLTSDDLESDIFVNVSSTLTNTIIWFVAALSLIVDVRTYTYRRTDTFTGFIRSSLRRLYDLKSGVLGHKSSKSLKRVKIEEKLL